MISTIRAFITRNLLIETSYRLTFFSNIVAITINLTIYFFINKLFGDRIVGHLKEFGVNYISYVLLSMASISYIGAGMGSFADQIRREQVEGTLENLLTTPITTRSWLMAMSAWNLCFALMDTMIYILLGIFIFHADFSRANLCSLSIILLLIMTSFSGMGIFSASFILLLKRASPLSWLFSSVEGLLGGTYFPITVLPLWLQTVAGFFPITYAIRAIQLSVYRGYSVAQLRGEIGILFLFSIILLPLSLRMFTWSLRQAKRRGNLGQF